jgi:hypothetical protein
MLLKGVVPLRHAHMPFQFAAYMPSFLALCDTCMYRKSHLCTSLNTDTCTIGEVMALALHPNGALVATGERCSASSTAAADGVSNKYVSIS